MEHVYRWDLGARLALCLIPTDGERPLTVCRLYIALRGWYLTSFAVDQFYVPKVTEASGSWRSPMKTPSGPQPLALPVQDRFLNQ